MSAPESWRALLDTCVAKQWLTPQSARKAAALCEHGLHPEQVLLGTGLLSLDQYGELVAQGAVAPRSSSSESVDIYRLSPRQIVARLLNEAAERRAYQVRIKEDRQGISVVFDDHPREASAFSLPRAAFSAALFRLAHEAPRQGWSFARERIGNDEHVRLVRQRPWPDREHPAEWSFHLNKFLSSPDGLLVMIKPDRYVEEKISRQCMSVADEDDGRPLLLPDPVDTEAAEAIEHALLSGQPVAIVTHRDGNERSWIRTAVQAGIHVSVIRSVLTPEGRMWESYVLPLNG